MIKTMKLLQHYDSDIILKYSWNNKKRDNKRLSMSFKREKTYREVTSINIFDWGVVLCD
jgi:hypothetical protein